MRKRSFFTGFVFVLFCGLFLTGCVSNNHVFDKSITEENLSILKIPPELSAVKFDDTKVKWHTNPWGFYLNSSEMIVTVKIPAGEHTLIVNYFSTENHGSYTQTRTADGIEVKYDFQPGITYKLSARMVGYNKIAVIVEEY
jgi:hypothetical protein